MVKQFDPESDNLPKFSELEEIPGAPKGAAWFWGKDDELGRLNLLTPKRVAAAARLIRTGQVVNLDLPAHIPDPPFFGRKGFKHEIKSIAPHAFDDLYNMNTQSGSQWDGFRHVGLAVEGGHIFYNNVTKQEILDTTRCGVQAWAEHGIVDYYSWKNKSYSPFSSHQISAKDIMACAESQGVKFQYGDILIVRSGWSEAYKKLDHRARQEMGTRSFHDLAFAGVERTPEVVEFLHDNYFSAVAGDTPAFESWPRLEPDHLHHFLLPLWGVPIGEMWDLDQLAETCKKLNRYTFFFSSSPANVSGGVASHPNALAMF